MSPAQDSPLASRLPSSDIIGAFGEAGETGVIGAIDVVVATGGAALEPTAVAALPPGAIIVAADGGLDWARAAGLEPDVLVGDLDSVSASGRAWASEHAQVLVHSDDKAATDTELAIEHAASLRPRRLVLIAGQGDRIDHSVAAIGALGSSSLDEIGSVEAWWGANEIRIATLDRPVTLDHPGRTTFSVLAMHGPSRGVSISGARWPLRDADLGPLVGEGVSNQVLDPPVQITVRHGVLTVMIPGAQP